MPARFSNPPKVAFLASRADNAQDALQRLQARYPHVAPSEADVFVVLGGDGFLLETLHELSGDRRPIYGMNQGTVGFLLNTYREEALVERLMGAVHVSLHPLIMTAETYQGGQFTAEAINEVSLLRETRQAAHLKISVDGVVRMQELICDGVILATPAGSTAYNLSAHGPIVPMRARLLALTPISAFRPRRWRGALLPDTVEVSFEVLQPVKRPVSAVADSTEVRDVRKVTVRADFDTSYTLLFDPDHQLEERIFQEQFDY